ncbi:hypothetical protein HD806DRAFT_425863 [Xylariaceae sp. AK1471]|nr:hypothetical protein HD806DRAFT_425863 [Xylariaceae sp. AK1471]
MDPISALSLACNIIDLVGKAIKGGATVVQVYKSVKGLSNSNEIINRAADSLGVLVIDLQACQSRTPDSTANQKMREISATVVSQCAELQSVLDDCRSSKRWGIFSASKASTKSFLKSRKIQQLNDDIALSRDELFGWIAASTRTDVEATLRQLEAISKTNCEISTTLKTVNDQLDAVRKSTENNAAENGLEEIKQVVADQVILQLLDFPNLGSRFEDIGTQEEGTFEWIFIKPEVAFEKEPRLAITFPGWLESGDGIFHICGKPGSGKSTLMKYLCHHPTTEQLLAKWSGHDELLFAKFFFWRIGVVQEQRNMKGLIRGLLYQALCKIPKLSRVIFSAATRDKLVKGIQKQAGAELHSQEIIEAFSKLVEVSKSSNPSQGLRGIRICLFVDGLDEFDDSEINQTHRELVHKLCQWTANSDGHIKICVSSRIQEPFMQMLDESKRFKLHNLTQEDIRLFVEQQLDNHPRFQIYRKKSPRECEDLIQEIRESADGVFLYVALVVKSLGDGLDKWIPIDRLQKTVFTMPKDLNTLLEQIISGINKKFGDGPEVLLAALLRATGTLLSPENRGPEYVLFDEAPFRSVREFNLSVLGSFFVLRAIDRGVSMQEKFTANKFEIEKEGWFRDGMSEDEIMNEICAAVRARLNGLIDTVGAEVKFIHRSVPEFLHTYFSRFSSNIHNDHRATVVMSWSYLVDIEWDKAKHARSLSLFSFISDNSASRADQATGDTESTEYNSWGAGSGVGVINEDTDEDVDEDTDKHIDEHIDEDTDEDTDDDFSRNNLSDRSTAFVCRLRQMKIGAEREDLFRILLFIDQALGEGSGPLTPKYYPPQDLSFSENCAFLGLHEFIDWLFRETEVFANHTRRFRVMLCVTLSYSDNKFTKFSLMVMETVFAHGFNSHMVFPCGTGLEREGRPLWHAVLLELIPFTTHDYLKQSLRHWRAGVRFDDRWIDIVADIIELWLRHGANPRICFRVSKIGYKCEGVSSALDYSGYISSSQARFGVENVLGYGLRDKGAKELSLRDVMLYQQPHNIARLLDLLPNDVPVAQKPSDVESNSSEVDEYHLAPRAEATPSLKHPVLEATKDNGSVSGPTQWLHGWTRPNYFVFIGVIGFIVACLFQFIS